jgi:hypothetical protein
MKLPALILGIIAGVIFVTNAYAIPKNRIYKSTAGDVWLVIYKETQFGWVEETYRVGCLSLNSIQFVYNNNGTPVLMNRLGVNSITDTVFDNDQNTSAVPLCFPSLASQPSQPTQPVVNVAQVAQALRDNVNQNMNTFSQMFQMVQAQSHQVAERQRRNQSIAARVVEEEKIGRLPPLDDLDFTIDPFDPFWRLDK